MLFLMVAKKKAEKEFHFEWKEAIEYYNEYTID